MAKKTPQATTPKKRTSKPVPARSLLGDLRQLIAAAREQTARAVNSTLVTMYWQIGKRIREDVLHQQRASYGEEIVYALSRQLTAEYGRGFTRANLFHMIRFAEVFPDEEIVNVLRSQLSWTHFRELLPIDDVLKRDFYAEMCRVERWSTRTLRHKIGHLLYERTAVSRKPAVLIANDIAALRDEDRLSPDKNGSLSTAKTTTSTCCSTIADCDVWWRLISSWASFKPPTKARWNCTCAGYKSTTCSPEKNRPSV